MIQRFQEPLDGENGKAIKNVGALHSVHHAQVILYDLIWTTTCGTWCRLSGHARRNGLLLCPT